MPTFESNNFEKSILSPHSAGEVYVCDDKVTLPTTIVDGDIVKMGHLPADCMPIDLVIRTVELDSDATDLLRFSVGLLNDAGDALIAGTELVVDAQAEAIKTIRGDGAGFMGIERDKVNDRILAIEIKATAETAVAGDLRMAMTYRASDYGA